MPSKILSAIEGVLRGTLKAQDLKRALQDRKRRQQLEDLQFGIAENRLAQSELTLAAQPGLIAQETKSNRISNERAELTLGTLQENAADPFGDARFEKRIREFGGGPPPQLPQMGAGEDVSLSDLSGGLTAGDFPKIDPPKPLLSDEDISKALRGRLLGRPPRLSQRQIKTPEGQFNVTFDAQGNEINRVRLGDLPPSTAAGSTQVDLSKFPGLTNFDLLAARNLAVKLFKSRAGNKTEIVELIMGLKARGMTEDEIGDRLLTEETSPIFTGPIRNAFEFVTRSGLSKDQRDTNRDTLDRILETQDVEVGKEFLLSIARDKGTAQERNQVRGRDEALLALDAIEDLILVKTATGPLRGRLQRIQQRFAGLAGNERVALLDQEIALAVIDYRQAKSGAAFTESEERLYERIFPSIQNSSKLNLVKVESLRKTFQRNQRAFYIRGLGKRNYLDLFGNEGVPGRETQQQTDSELEDLFEEMGGDN